MKISIIRNTLGLLVFICSVTLISAQDTKRQVTRCGAVDRSAPVRNIFVDSDGSKWVASGSGVYHVLACDLSNPLELGPGELSPYMYAGGNADARWTTEILTMVLGKAPEVTAAYYDQRNDWLWLGN